MSPPRILKRHPPTEQRMTLPAWEETSDHSVLTSVSHLLKGTCYSSLSLPTAIRSGRCQGLKVSRRRSSQVFVGQVCTSAAEHPLSSLHLLGPKHNCHVQGLLTMNTVSVPSPPQSSRRSYQALQDHRNTTRGPESHRKPSDIFSTPAGESSTTGLEPSSYFTFQRETLRIYDTQETLGGNENMV